jgi:hypothetical protein
VVVVVSKLALLGKVEVGEAILEGPLAGPYSHRDGGGVCGLVEASRKLLESV